MGALISKVQDMLFYLIRLQQIHKITSYLRQSQTRSPPNPLIRKSRDRVPHTKCSGITFKTRTKNKPYSKVLVARLTVLKYHKFLNRHSMSLRVLLLQPILCSMLAKYYVSNDYLKLRYGN